MYRRRAAGRMNGTAARVFGAPSGSQKNGSILILIKKAECLFYSAEGAFRIA